MKNIIKRFSRAKLFFYAASLLVLLILLTGILSPLYINNIDKNWNSILERKIASIEKEVRGVFTEREEELMTYSSRLKEFIEDVSNSGGNLLESLIEAEADKNFLVEIYDKDYNLIFWNDREIFGSDSLINLISPLNEVKSIESDLTVNMLYIDSLITGRGFFFIVAALPIEKKYTLSNEYFKAISITDELDERFESSFAIDFSDNPGGRMDGRDSAFEILNSRGNKIAVVNFRKPQRSAELVKYQNLFNNIQSVLTIAAFLLIAAGLSYRFKKIGSKLVKLFIISAFLVILRYLFYVFDLPGIFIRGDLTNASYFSSTFAFGMVRSPIDLFISVLFFLIVCLKGYQYGIAEYFNSGSGGSKSKIISILAGLFFPALYFLSYRGLAASIKSVIFDSTLRYFDGPSLMPALPNALIHLNVLILGFCAIIGSIVFLLLTVRYLSILFPSKKNNLLIILFILFQILGFLFDHFQNEPQGTPVIRILYITSTFILLYLLIRGGRGQILYFLYSAFAASIITVNLLNYYNSELERESLKVYAIDLVRPNENFLEFILRETLQTAINNDSYTEEFRKDDPNFNSLAFRIWAASLLQRDGISSLINIWDEKRGIIGSFDFKFDIPYIPVFYDNQIQVDRLTIIKEKRYSNNYKVLRGIIPVRNGENTVGYLELAVVYDTMGNLFQKTLPFLSNHKTFADKILEFQDLIILDFQNDNLLHEFSNINVNRNIIDNLLRTDLSEYSEAWKDIQINQEEYKFYILGTVTNGESRRLAVGFKMKDASWNLFDFFKVFFIHCLMIAMIFACSLLFMLGKQRELKISFRGQLLVAFLIISILPMLLLAVYFRNLTDEKSTSTIFYKLGKRANNIEAYINDYLYETISLETLLNKTAKDLRIDYSIYRNNKLFYSSNKKYYEIGLFSGLLNPEVYYQLFDQGRKETVVRETIENYAFNSYYFIGNIGSEEYIFEVNDLFNNILIPLSDVELDIFLFGTYSLAVILIVIISTLIANQISAPIRKLTSATKSVAVGDLNIEVAEDQKGEINELVKGFNMMVRELKKGQAELAEMERETAWKEMAKQVAHEIKNPLTPMKLSLQQLTAAHRDKSSKFDDIFDKVTNTIITQIETLKNIASEFSNFARMPALKTETIDVLMVCNEIIDLFSHETVVINLSTELPEGIIEADRDQLKRTFINIIRNSIQAEADKITILISEIEKYFQLRFIDNGNGISSEIIGSVFEENFTTKTHGMGLGLAMSKRNIEQIGGSIQIEKTSSQGTVVLIELLKPER